MQDRHIEQCGCHGGMCEERRMTDNQAGEQWSEVKPYVLIKVKESVTS